jgi:hypothetical protein
VIRSWCTVVMMEGILSSRCLGVNEAGFRVSDVLECATCPQSLYLTCLSFA